MAPMLQNTSSYIIFSKTFKRIILKLAGRRYLLNQNVFIRNATEIADSTAFYDVLQQK